MPTERGAAVGSPASVGPGVADLVAQDGDKPIIGGEIALFDPSGSGPRLQDRLPESGNTAVPPRIESSYLEGAKEFANSTIDTMAAVGQNLQSLTGAAGLAAVVTVGAKNAGLPPRSALTLGVATGVLASFDSGAVQAGAIATVHAAIDLCGQEVGGNSQMAPLIDVTTLGDGTPRLNLVERIPESEVGSRTEDVVLESLLSRPERLTEEGDTTEKDVVGISMIPSMFEESPFTLENIISFGVKILTFLLVGLVFPWIKPVLKKEALHIRPYYTLLYQWIWEFSESPFLNHGTSIRIFCCFFLLFVFVLIKMVTGV